MNTIAHPHPHPHPPSAVAELIPREAPPLRALVSVVGRTVTSPGPSLALALPHSPTPSEASRADTYAGLLLTSEVTPTHPARDAVRRDDVEPLDADLRRLLAGVPVVWFTRQDAEGAASIWQHLTGHQRELVGDRDLLMAGTALARGWPVLTRNRRHFKLTGVELLDPSQ